MTAHTKISWCTHTANLWHGCTKVHTGCDHCYAEALSKRWGNDIWGYNKPRLQIKSVWSDLAKYQNWAKKANEIHRVFVGSMMDIFESDMPLIDSKGNKLEYSTEDLRRRFFREVVPNSPNLIFLLLTKRPSNINRQIPDIWKIYPPKNVMFGTSPVNQKTSDTLITQLLAVEGKRFLSVEPQLESINLKGFLFNGGIDWVIQGGESGHHKRPFNLDWAYYLKQQCADTDTPYFFKQIDKVRAIPDDLIIEQFPKQQT